MIKILFVCHGNICRSPMGEFVLKDMVRKAGLEHKFQIASAAVSREEVGNPVYPPARREMAKHGIRCDGHVAHQITQKEYDRMTVSMFGPKHHPFNNSLADFALEAEFIQVNMNGKRWIGEMNNGIMFGYSQKISEQPKEISYAIMPYDQLKACAERFVADPRQWNKKHFYATWEEDIEHEATLDTPVKKADTLEELGVLIGADPKVFVDEIKKYNSFCEKGVDEDFGKDPKFLIPIPLDKGPYYAVYGQRFSEAAMGGVTVNDKTQVLRNDGSIIPGLYAGGDCTSAMHRKGELAPLSELTWAMAASYVAGGNMVRYIDGKEEKAGGAA